MGRICLIMSHRLTELATLPRLFHSGIRADKATVEMERFIRDASTQDSLSDALGRCMQLVDDFGAGLCSA
jgi:hypothetical protein